MYYHIPQQIKWIRFIFMSVCKSHFNHLLCFSFTAGAYFCDVTMADVHDSAVTQQQLYEQRVMFFLAPDEFFPDTPTEPHASAGK